MSDKNQMKGRIIHENVLKKGKFLSIDITRWVEAGITISIVGFGLYQIPFVPRVKWIVIVVICTCLLFMFLKGIRNRSVFQLLYDMIKDSKFVMKCSLGGPQDERKNNVNEQYQFGGESYFDRFKKKLFGKFRDFDEKYGS